MRQVEIWLISLDPTIGAEIRKTRPAIVVNDNALSNLPLKIIVPITDWKERYGISPCIVKITVSTQTNLTKDSAADCFQIRSVAEERCIKLIGTIDAIHLQSIQIALSKVLSL